MPWNERSAMSLRTEFVLFASQEGANIRALCRQFGIAPATAYKWLHRWQSDGRAGLNRTFSSATPFPFQNTRYRCPTPPRCASGHPDVGGAQAQAVA
ncbi:Uncharacterised protein [Serratia fonticola]|uniref:Insertion element IS150 protein InsJ-like helix-turn-helix domain-containing protein n=1 Tax=Serratia fonticola TaxID=47917 RepID=A0A4U9WLF9_SERFO|nr:Uncharacterised protein [Serratia fonticola]